MTGRPLLPAVVPPFLAYALVRDHDDVLRRVESRGRAVARNQPEVGAQLVSGVALIRESARQLVERDRERVTSAGGTAEVPSGADEAQSESVISMHPQHGGLTVAEVAENLGLSLRQVRNLCEGGRLSATKHQGQWVIDEISAEAEKKRRNEE